MGLFGFIDEIIDTTVNIITYPVRYPFIKVEENEYLENWNRVTKELEEYFGKEIEQWIDQAYTVDENSLIIIFTDKTKGKIHYKDYDIFNGDIGFNFLKTPHQLLKYQFIFDETVIISDVFGNFKQKKGSNI